MISVRDCFFKVKKDCYKFISSEETKKEKFRNKDKMIRSYLIPVSFWIANKVNKKNPIIKDLFSKKFNPKIVKPKKGKGSFKRKKK